MENMPAIFHRTPPPSPPYPTRWCIKKSPCPDDHHKNRKRISSPRTPLAIPIRVNRAVNTERSACALPRALPRALQRALQRALPRAPPRALPRALPGALQLAHPRAHMHALQRAHPHPQHDKPTIIGTPCSASHRLWHIRNLACDAVVDDFVRARRPATDSIALVRGPKVRFLAEWPTLLVGELRIVIRRPGEHTGVICVNARTVNGSLGITAYNGRLQLHVSGKPQASNCTDTTAARARPTAELVHHRCYSIKVRRKCCVIREPKAILHQPASL